MREGGSQEVRDSIERLVQEPPRALIGLKQRRIKLRILKVQI